MNKFSKLAFIAAASIMTASVSAQEAVPSNAAQAAPSVVQQPRALGAVPASKQPENGNWVSGSGDTVWLNGSGERCLRSSSWTPATANKGCDGALVEVAPPQAPAAPVTTPVPVAREKITYQKEIQYEFDKSALRNDGKALLDTLVNEIKQLDTLEMIVVNGYTDEIGTDSYNMNLSLRRIEPVKSYLISQGIAESKIYTEGKGKSDPIIADCKQQVGNDSIKGKGKKAKAQKVKAKIKRAELLKCLAPNRRVKIDAIGTSSAR